MEGVEKWLLCLYLPLLAPLVVLTFFTWPWKVIGHAFRGLAMSLRSTWRGYSRSRHSHRRRPFSLWRNMFLGTWIELAKQHNNRTGASLVPSGGQEMGQAYLDTLLEATKETQTSICGSLRASLTAHSIFAAFLFVVLVRPMPGAGNGQNSIAVDLSALFAGLAFILSLAIVGVYAHLSSLLPIAGTPEQFYWLVCSWERAVAGGQLATASIITFTFGSALAACWELFADWVFIVLLFSACTLLYGYLYFWADSMWCPYNGAYVHFSQAFHRDLVGRDTLQAHPSCCAFWELEPVLTMDARGSLYDRMDRYLWRESQVSWYVGSSGGAVLGHNGGGDGIGGDLYASAKGGDYYGSGKPAAAGGNGSGRSSPLPTTAAGAAAGVAGAAAAGPAKGSGKVATEPSLYSGWPSLMRYTSGSNTKLGQARAKRSSSSGLAAVSESNAGAGPRSASANLPA